MQRLLATIAALSVAACSSQPAQEPAAPESEAAPVAAATGPAPGDYEVTLADGTVVRTTLNADGSYTDYNPDGSIAAEGSWAVTDGKTCFTPTTQGVESMCFTEGPPAADGSFSAMPDKGDAVTVRLVPAQAEAAPTE